MNKILKKLFYLANILLLLFFANTSLAKETDLGKITGPGSRFEPNTGAEFTGEGGTGTIFENIFSTVLGIFTVIGGIMFIIYLALGALSWITAGGKQEQLEKARNQMTNGLIGLIVLVAAYSLFYIIGLVLGLDFLNPAEMVKNIVEG